MSPDPYVVLGVSHNADVEEIRAAYRRLVKLHHPDHNGGSRESAERFEEVQEAYAAIARGGPQMTPPTGSRGGQQTPPTRSRGGPTGSRERPTPPPSSDPALDARLADLERQVQEAQSARRRAERAAREAAAAVRREAAAADGRKRPTDEELGYVHTDDSLGHILADARAELAERLAAGSDHPVTRRVSDLIAGLEDLAEGLDRRGRDGDRPDTPPSRRGG